MGEKKLAVIFPGMGYHNDKPLLYHGKKLAKERGYEVVEVNYVLDKNAGAVKDDEAQRKEVFRWSGCSNRKIHLVNGGAGIRRHVRRH